MPYPESDTWQSIDNLVISAPFSYTVHHEPEYKNGMVFLEAQPPPADGGQVTVTF